MKFWFILLTLTMAPACGAPESDAMTASPIMPDPAALAGDWVLQGPQGACDIHLGTASRPLSEGSLAAPMLAAQVANACGGAESVAGWNAAPLGLYLADAAGFAVITFEQAGPGSYRSIDQAWTLTRP